MPSFRLQADGNPEEDREEKTVASVGRLALSQLSRICHSLRKNQMWQIQGAAADEGVLRWPELQGSSVCSPGPLLEQTTVGRSLQMSPAKVDGEVHEGLSRRQSIASWTQETPRAKGVEERRPGSPKMLSIEKRGQEEVEVPLSAESW